MRIQACRLAIAYDKRLPKTDLKSIRRCEKAEAHGEVFDHKAKGNC